MIRNRSFHRLLAFMGVLLALTAVQAQDAPPNETLEPTATFTLTPTGTEAPPTATQLPTETEAPAEITAEAEPEATEEPESETTPEATVESEPPTESPPATLETAIPQIPVLPDEPTLHLLAAESFDSGDLSAWQVGAGWSLVESEGGRALQAVNSSDATTYTQGIYFNVAAQARFASTSGSAQLSVRVSQVGSYSVVMDSSGSLQLLRAGTPVAAVSVPPVESWRVLRLSAINGILRVAVDQVEVLVYEDSAPLPPGNVGLSAGFPSDGGLLLADDFMLWIPLSEYVPTETPPTVTPEQPTPTAEVTEEPEAAPALLAVDPVTLKALVEVSAPSEAQILSALASGNDDFADAVTITALHPGNRDNGDTTSATLETGEILPFGCGFNVGRTVWFSFTPADTGSYTIDLAGSAFDTVLAVYTGGAMDSLTQVGCNDDANSNTLSSRVTLNLTAGTPYLIQIGGFQQAFGLYDIIIQRNRIAGAASPRLTNPINGTTLVDQTPALNWNPANNAVDYVVQIATDSRFNNIVVSEDTSATTFAPGGDLAEGRYFWRVAGRNSNGDQGRFSSVWNFTISLTPPQPILPAAESISKSTRPGFRFTGYGSGALYDIQLSDTDDFSGDLDHSFTCNRTSCASNAFAQHQGTWHWRVGAIDSEGNPTAYSDSLPFNVDLLRAPVDGAVAATATTAAVTFSWFGAAGATGYILQIDDGPDFGSPDEYPTTLTSMRVSGLTYGEYQWRVVATGLDDSAPDLLPARALIISPPLPPAPTLLTPARGATIADLTPNLDWDDVAGTDITYNLQICSRSNCRPDSTIIESVTDLTDSQYTVTTDLPDGRTAYWMVQAVNEYGAAGRFTNWPLIVRTAPPQLSSPRNESSTTDTTPYLRWSSYPGATYDLEIDNDADFGSPLLTENGLTSTGYTVAAALIEGTYHWRVRAVDGTPDHTATAFSAPFSFTIGPRPPGAPRLTSPINGSMLADTTPLFGWDVVTDAATYCLQVADHPRFFTPLIDECGLPDTDFTPSSDLDPGIYYWRVRSVNTLGGVGGYSRTNKVTVQTDGPQPRSPRANSVTRDTTPTLQWTTYPGAALYNIRIDDEVACDSSLDVFTSTRNVFTPPMLDQGTYFWCVQAVDYLNNAESLTDFGPTFEMTVNILISPNDGAITGDTTPYLRWQSAASGALYCIDFDDETSFDSVEPNDLSFCGLTGTGYTLPTRDYGIYYWRVRVSTNGGSTYQPDTPPYRMLTISPTAPSTPGLLLPNNRATIWTSTPDLTWKPSRSGDPIFYEVEIATDPRFAAIVLSDTLDPAACSADACSLPVNPALAIDTTYYWRVRAMNAHSVYSRYSSTFRFNVINPVAPTMISPADNSNTTSSQPTFKWRGLPGAATYTVRLEAVNPPTQVAGEGIRGAAFRPATPLVIDTYFWQVQGFDVLGTPSGWSAIWTLKISSPNNAVPLLNRFGPGSTDAPHTVVLTWGPISWTIPGGWYEIVVDDQPNLKSPVYVSPHNDSVLPTGTQEILEGDLPTLTNGIYYWRVRACNSGGQCGKWSSTGAFVVDR